MSRDLLFWLFFGDAMSVSRRPVAISPTPFSHDMTALDIFVRLPPATEEVSKLSGGHGYLNAGNAAAE